MFTNSSELHNYLSQQVIANFNTGIPLVLNVNGFTMDKNDIETLLMYLEANINFGDWRNTTIAPPWGTVLGVLNTLNS